jgi:type I restriction enzyme S subunit
VRLGLRRYSDYRSSGAEWIGDVPSHWHIKPIKYVAEFVNGAAFKPEEWSTVGTPIIRIENLNGGEEFNFYVGDIDPKYHVSEGDLLFGWSGNRGTSFGPFVWSRPGRFFLNQHIFRVSTSTASLRWLYWALKAVTCVVEEEAHGIIGMVHVTKGRLGSIPLCVPNSDEQYSIAAFLDRETTRIDALIEKKRRLIELLEEKRQAAIARVITKGLDQTAPLKASGVDWLSDIPAHWEIVPLRYVASEYCDGPFGSGLKSEHYVDEGVRVIRLQNIRAGAFNDSDAVFIEHSYFATELKRHEVLPDDVLIAGLGDDRNVVGRACVAPPSIGPAIVKADCFRFRLKRDRALPAFVAAQLTIGSEQAAGALSTGSTRSRIPLSVMASRKIALPNIAEQVDICNQVELLTVPLRNAKVAIERSVWLLENRRSSLITSAVTGKINLRGHSVATSQPDRSRLRALVAAEIADRHREIQRFGRVKLQKLLYLAEAHAGVHELQGNYFREAAGPLDSGMIADAERGMAASRYFDSVAQGKTGSGVSYAPLAGAGKHRPELINLLGAREVALTHVINLLRGLDTRASEVIATIYALWNDDLLDGESPDDDRIVQAFLNEWHPEKRQKFKEAEVRHWLDWMKRNSLVPAGRGPKTTSTVPRDMFS